ncbi:Nucleotidyltransferase domain-containing protein [Stigmatella aurantiaca]|uniref:Nucleotidyltransferase domain-containing protein n=1 Tax=Stigmatella aurantiaca TaxID=41 RepID=A0A1H7YRF6_STIAU|nr:nucleotidyltransferase [Stigmatella aurantiaca]SEM48856.1 Nucleotidyltransferase domain-containing protein [Stigmatella aurantiaca]
MWSVREALERFIQSLELTEGQQQEVVRQQTQVRECLVQRLQAKKVFLSGSYSRNTAIRPLHDIDLFVVLGAASLSSPLASASSTISMDAVFKQVQQALKQEWSNKGPRLQNHSVHIGFEESGIAFDVVPAYADPSSGQEVFLIPEKDTGQWIRTSPNIHKQRSTEANETAGKKLKPLLKAVKHWKRTHGSSPLRSFHLEVMSYSAFNTPPRDYLEGLERLFTHLSQRVQSPCPDPAHLGPAVDHLMSPTQREAAHQVLAGAARQARLAREESDSNPSSAHTRLINLFGEFYRKG